MNEPFPDPESAANDSLRSLPNNPDAERAALSCALQWPDECIDQIAARPEGEALFYRPAHRDIWRGIRSLRESGEPVELVGLATELERQGKIEGVGGIKGLADLLDDVPAASLLPEYLRFLAEAYRPRTAIQRLTTAASSLFDSKTTPEEAEAILARTAGALHELLESGTSTDDLRPFRESLLKAVEQIEKHFHDDSPIPGIPTGFPELDEATNGLPEGKMIILAGLSGGGKTALGLQLLLQIAARDIPCGIFSLEMYAVELAFRAISAAAKIDGLKMARGFLGKSDLPKILGAAGKLANLPIWVDDRAGMSIGHIVAGVRKLVREQGVRVVLVDYLGIIKEPDDSRGRVDAVTKLSNALNQLAKETGVVMIVLAQLNRDSEKRPGGKPKKSDLKDSSAIEQDAFGVLLLHEKKPEGEGEQSDSIVDVDVIVDKWRGGRTGPVPMQFVKPMTTFQSAPKPA